MRSYNHCGLPHLFVGLCLVALGFAPGCGSSPELDPVPAPVPLPRPVAAPDPVPDSDLAPAPDPVPPTPITLPPIQETCVIPSRTPARPVRSHVYSRPDGHAQRLDLVMPNGEGPHPVVLLFHGGGWSAGERVHLRDEILALANAGYAGASADYRLFYARQNLFPAPVADVRCAVRYLRRRAGELNIDPNRIAVGGFSAGAHLALMLATAPEVEGLDEGCDDTLTSPEVRSAIAYFAPSDLRASAPYPRGADRIIANFLGVRRQADPELAALASPIVHVDGNDAPVLLAHAIEDGVVPVAQSRDMRSALAAVGVPVREVEVPGTTHGFRLLSTRPHHRRSTCTSLAFLAATLAPP